MQDFLTANLEIASNGKFMGALFPHGQSNKQTNKQTNQPTKYYYKNSMSVVNQILLQKLQ
jgi:hypothetical protein